MNRQLREKVKNNFEKDFELFRFRKDHRKCKETPRYHALRKKERKKKLKSEVISRCQNQVIIQRNGFQKMFQQ